MNLACLRDGVGGRVVGGGGGGITERDSFSVIGSPVFKVFIFAETEINIVSLETFD